MTAIQRTSEPLFMYVLESQKNGTNNLSWQKQWLKSFKQIMTRRVIYGIKGQSYDCIVIEELC